MNGFLTGNKVHALRIVKPFMVPCAHKHTYREKCSEVRQTYRETHRETCVRHTYRETQTYRNRLTVKILRRRCLKFV